MKSTIHNTENIFEFVKILGQQTDFKEVVRLVANKSAQLLKADLALILMLNPDTRKTIKTIFKDGRTIEQKEYRNIHIHVGGWIVNNKSSFLSTHIQLDERFADGLFDNIPVKAVAGVPLVIEGIIIGALILLYKNSLAIANQDLNYALENLATLSAPYLRNTQKIREYFKITLPETSLLAKYNNIGLCGKSPRFVEMLYAIEAATKCDARVLLIGKTGTGKEIIAKAIHNFSTKSPNPFIAIDCGAIPTTLLESEFFGHTKGAFTGAHSDRKGLFLEAYGGTMFMDEINNLPYDMQSKLLRVLEEGEIRPVGSNKTLPTDVRIIAASSVPLKNLVEDKLFREDLFFRLHVYPIYIPDLEERKEDIPILANHFLEIYAKKQNKKVQFFHEGVIDFFKQRTWDGNIRELENFVQRLVTITPENMKLISLEYFPTDLSEEVQLFREKSKIFNSNRSIKDQVQDFEAKLIRQTLIECNWNKSEAARRLNTSEKNIRYKIETLRISKETFE